MKNVVTKAIIPKKFRERYSNIIPNKKEFYRLCNIPIKPSIRVNTIKITVKNLINRLEKRGWKIKQEFLDYAFTVETPNSISNSIEHFLGYFYIQNLSSMIPPVVLNAKKNSTILDICAAPGSKTTHIAMLIKNTGVIVANDVSYERIKALRSNIERMGVLNCVVTRFNACKFPRKIMFDYILVDVPCSSEGIIRRQWNVLSRFSESNIKYFSHIQKRIVSRALELLKENGVLVYSTCTIAPEENEGVIDFLLKKFNVETENIKISIKNSTRGLRKFMGIRFEKGVEKCLRIWHFNNFESFFVAKIRKLS